MRLGGSIAINALTLGATGRQLWTPSQISTLAWYDASDTSPTNIVESSGDVSQWSDKSGNGYHLQQSTGSLQPRTGDTTQNGLNVLDGDGSVAMTATGASIPADQDFHIYIVQNRGTGDNLWELKGTVPTALRALDNSIAQGRQRGGAAFPATPDGTIGAFNLYYSNCLNSVIGSSNELNRYENGSITTVASSTTDPSVAAFQSGDIFSEIWAFDDSTGGNSLVGSFAEIIYTTSSSNRELIEGYLAHRWGIANLLAVGHPYRDTPPYV